MKLLLKRNLEFPIRIFIVIILPGLATSFLSGCATVYNPATQQKELILIDTGTEVMLGKQIDFQISQSYEIVKGTQDNERVNIIGKKVAEVSDRQDIRYIFKIVKDKEVNAFCTPGGYVYIHTGLLEKVNDDELACVIGHEIGHVAARHIVKKLQAQLGYELLVSLALGRGGAQEIEKALNVAFNIIALGYSREDEFLADKLGIKYAYKAGYDPQAMINFFKKLQELKKDKTMATPLFLRSHPYLEQRIERAGQEITKLQQPELSSLTLTNPQPLSPKNPTLSLQEEKTSTAFTTKYKKCPTCGKIYPRNYQYCIQDGSSLIAYP
ncbi:MAG: M48 family metallopeptidase [Candidatus Omnitrophica bacterium]|nr:M48 family metallopeptidase [Candidatus Omnitrophota bacterium]